MYQLLTSRRIETVVVRAMDLVSEIDRQTDRQTDGRSVERGKKLSTYFGCDERETNNKRHGRSRVARLERTNEEQRQRVER